MNTIDFVISAFSYSRFAFRCVKIDEKSQRNRVFLVVFIIQMNSFIKKECFSCIKFFRQRRLLF